MAQTKRAPHVLIAALVIFMLALLSACGVPGVSSIASPQPSPAAAEASVPAADPSPVAETSEPAATDPSPAAGAATTAVALLWPEPLPDGLRVDAGQSSIEVAGWTLSLFDPDDPQGMMWIRGSAGGAWASPHPNSRPVTVRGVQGNAFSTGAGWSVTWVEASTALPDRPEGAVYNVGGFLLSAERAVAIAETLQPVDEATFRQRLAAAGSVPASAPAAEADRQLVYTRFDVAQQHGELRAIALDSGAEQLLAATEPGCTISGLAVSPDHQRIAFSVDGCRTPGLHIIDADGSGERVLVEGSNQLGAYAFSPDGSRLALTKLRLHRLPGNEARSIATLDAMPDFVAVTK